MLNILSTQSFIYSDTEIHMYIPTHTNFVELNFVFRLYQIVLALKALSVSQF